MRLRVLMPVVATLVALLLIAAITAPLDAIPRETAPFVELLRKVLLSTNISPQLLATAVIPGIYAGAMTLWFVAGWDNPLNSIPESLAQSLEMRLKIVEERLNQLERDLYAHGHTYKSFDGDASDLGGIIRGVVRRSKCMMTL